MVIHQAVGVAPPMVTLHDVRQDGEKRLAIGVIAVDRLAGIAACGHMINGARVGKTQRSGHDHRILPKTDNSRPDPFDLDPFEPFF